MVCCNLKIIAGFELAVLRFLASSFHPHKGRISLFWNSCLLAKDAIVLMILAGHVVMKIRELFEVMLWVFLGTQDFMPAPQVFASMACVSIHYLGKWGSGDPLSSSSARSSSSDSLFNRWDNFQKLCINLFRPFQWAFSYSLFIFPKSKLNLLALVFDSCHRWRSPLHRWPPPGTSFILNRTKQGFYSSWPACRCGNDWWSGSSDAGFWESQRIRECCQQGLFQSSCRKTKTGYNQRMILSIIRGW